MNQVNQERLKEIESKQLIKGCGKTIDQACVMQMVSYVAGEEWTDHPECACPVLTSYAIRLNDRFDNESRQLLKPFIPKLVGTGKDAAKKKDRALFLVLESITSFLPILTDALELPEISNTLRAFKMGQWIEAREYLRSVRPTVRKAADADAAACAAIAIATADAAADAAAAAAIATAIATADADACAADAAAYAAAYAQKAIFWESVKAKLVAAGIKALSDAIDL